LEVPEYEISQITMAGSLHNVGHHFKFVQFRRHPGADTGYRRNPNSIVQPGFNSSCIGKFPNSNANQYSAASHCHTISAADICGSGRRHQYQYAFCF
jgi:hypothetical protein